VEKKLRIVFYSVALAIIGGLSIASCTISRPIVITGEQYIIAAQRSADRLAELSDRIGDTLEFASGEVDRIRGLADGATAGIALAIRLLDEYDDFVYELINRIAELNDLIARGDDETTEDAEGVADPGYSG
jgi:hypothetical protein